MASRLPQLTSSLILSARPALVSARAARALPAFRQLGAFAPTQSLLKKRGAAVADAFEEDDFSEFEESTQTDDIPAEVTRVPGKTRASHYQAAQSILVNALNQSHFGLRSNLPPASALTNTLDAASGAELPATLALLAKWRARSLPITPSALTSLRVACVRAKDPHTFVAALVDRTRYGLDLASARDADAILLLLSNPLAPRDGALGLEPKAAEQLATDLEALEQLRRAVRLAGAGEVDAVAAVCAASVAGLVDGQAELASQRVKEARSVGDASLMARVGEMNRRTQATFALRLRGVAKWAEEQADKPTAAWATKLADTIRV